jgi:hypothetical protein
VDAAIERRATVLGKAKAEFRTKKSSLCSKYPKLDMFPFPVQKLTVEQYNKADARFNEGREYFDLDSPFCDCEFSRKYCLPCKHVFLNDLYHPGFITLDHWETYADGWEESGCEVYRAKEPYNALKPVYDPVREAAVVNLFKEGS